MDQWGEEEGGFPPTPSVGHCQWAGLKEVVGGAYRGGRGLSGWWAGLTLRVGGAWAGPNEDHIDVFHLQPLEGAAESWKGRLWGSPTYPAPHIITPAPHITPAPQLTLQHVFP